MTFDPRCCGSGTCIVDADGRCWCGQQWDGEKMCNPPPSPRPAPAPPAERSDAAPPRADAGRRALSIGFACTALPVALAAALSMPPPASAAPAPAPAPTPTPAPAPAPLPEREARAVRAVIEAQLKALSGGDAPGAFAHASAAIRTQFRTAAGFMSMVQAGYPMLLKASATSFFVPEWANGTWLQKLQLRDRAGLLWRVTYQMEQLADSTWRINGCVVVPDSDKSSA